MRNAITFAVMLIISLSCAGIARADGYPMAKALAFTKKVSDTCGIYVMDMKTMKPELATSVQSCPEKLIPAYDRYGFFALFSDSVIEIDLSDGINVKPAIKLPVSESKELPCTPVHAGYLRNGSFASVMLCPINNGLDDTMNLFTYKNDEWSLTEKQECFKFDPCIVWPESAGPQDIGLIGNGREIWQEYQKNNPYVTAMSEKIGDMGEAEGEVTFRFAEKESLLFYNTELGPDTPTTLTFKLSLTPSGQNLIKLSDEQCETALMGKYLLLYKFWGNGTHLIDIETGQSMLGTIENAIWLFPKN